MKEVSGAIPAHLMAESPLAAKSKNAMGKDDFMKLLMAQLRHQDPMKPMDHQEFATQLAQFGQLEQLSNIGTGIQGLRTGMGEGAKLQALGMIGKKIQASGAEVELVEGQNVSLHNSLKADVQPVKAAIYNASGILVREIDLNGKAKTEMIQWDGKSKEGVQLPSGKYTFRVHGVDRNGQGQEVGTELSGRVTGVEMDGQNPLLLVQSAGGQSKIELAKVKQVMLDGEAKPDAAAKITPELKLSPPPIKVALAPAPPESEDVTGAAEAAEAIAEPEEPRESRGFHGLMEGLIR